MQGSGTVLQRLMAAVLLVLAGSMAGAETRLLAMSYPLAQREASTGDALDLLHAAAGRLPLQLADQCGTTNLQCQEPTPACHYNSARQQWFCCARGATACGSSARSWCCAAGRSCNGDGTTSPQCR